MPVRAGVEDDAGVAPDAVIRFCHLAVMFEEICERSFAAADERDMAMIFTGVRHFRH